MICGSGAKSREEVSGDGGESSGSGWFGVGGCGSIKAEIAEECPYNANRALPFPRTRGKMRPKAHFLYANESALKLSKESRFQFSMNFETINSL